MKRGRILLNGAIRHVTEHEGQVRLSDGRLVAEDAVTWLPPVAPRTCFALGLNYADHAKELAFKAPETPLVFLKGPTMNANSPRSSARRRAMSTRPTPWTTSRATRWPTTTPSATTWKTTIAPIFG
jgi:5-oxopent-3-ene-1,2,5-tricarboxylate decarboxylase/2-hydroxyhepta-2,4-diene-1,7-dioate isomerase